MFSIEFKDGYAIITVGERANKFECDKEDEEALTHMMNVIANSSGLYGTDIVDFECVFERCSNHHFTTYLNGTFNQIDPLPIKSESKAVILLIIGSVDMGLSDVNALIDEVVALNSEETEIIFTAENSEKIVEGRYMLCILD